MTYRSTKKIYPGNYAEPLNGWYQNVATGAKTVQGRTGSAGGPTAVLACPGWRYFQFMGYVPITNVSGGTGQNNRFQVIVPSPYKNDPTRVNITGMVVSGNAPPTNNISVGRGPAYIYRAAISVPTGWDNTVASGIANTDPTSILTFGLANGGSATDLGNPTDPTAVPAENNDTPCSQANIQFDTTSLTGQGFIQAGTEGISNAPLIVSTGEVAITEIYKQVTGVATYQVFSRDAATSTAANGGLYISAADAAAGKTGYIFVELDFIQQDNAPEYSDLNGYLPFPQEPRGTIGDIDGY
jgi:hypothetical protein